MWTKPPTFSHSVKPLDAGDWLNKLEKKLQVVQYANREREFYLQHTSWLDKLQTGGMPMLKPTRREKLSTGRNSGIASELITCRWE
jgi:hypothetical protein